jgi:hypothetical protein
LEGSFLQKYESLKDSWEWEGFSQVPESKEGQGGIE